MAVAVVEGERARSSPNVSLLKRPVKRRRNYRVVASVTAISRQEISQITVESVTPINEEDDASGPAYEAVSLVVGDDTIRLPLVKHVGERVRSNIAEIIPSLLR